MPSRLSCQMTLSCAERKLDQSKGEAWLEVFKLQKKRRLLSREETSSAQCSHKLLERGKRKGRKNEECGKSEKID